MNRRKLLLLAGGTLAGGCVANADLFSTLPPEWRAGPGLNRPKQEIYPALHNGEIWLSGGFFARDGRIAGPTDETLILNPLTGEWREGPGIPAPRHHPQLQSHDGKLYVLGGFQAIAADGMWQMQAGGWRLDADGWNEIPALPMPLGEGVTASLGDALHFAGGRTPTGGANAAWSDHNDTGAHFRLMDGQWEAASPVPTPRNSSTAEVINGVWHVVGGRTVSGGNSAVHEAYLPDEDRWVTLAPMPQAQGGLASGVIDGKLYAFGGEYFVGEGTGVYPECWVYDPAADSWAEGPAMRTPRHGLGGVTLNNQIYAIGGATRRSGSETSALVDVLGA